MESRAEGKPRDLECLGPFVGQEVDMELKGGEPVVSERREIALRGVVVEVDELSPEKTVTIRIPLSHLATLHKAPRIPDE